MSLDSMQDSTALPAQGTFSAPPRRQIVPKVITIDPVSRIEGHLKIEVEVERDGDAWRVANAWSTGTLFRGFEQILVNRHPWDAVAITQRICGVCPVSHGVASSMALEAAANITIPTNGRLQRNIVLGANFLQSHILHFYHLALLDYVKGPAQGPWSGGWEADLRLDAGADAELMAHYTTALQMRRDAHTLGAIFGGRMPHPPAFMPGGFTNTPTAAQIALGHTLIDGLIAFIQGTYVPDVEFLGTIYPDYYEFGFGVGRLLSFGVFEQDQTGTNHLLARGRALVRKNQVQPVDVAVITEDVTHSWYNDATSGLAPSLGLTMPQHPKDAAYSWLKAPRYAGQPYEAGPLARMWVNGDYRAGVSVMDRHLARAMEALKVAQAIKQWLSALAAGASAYAVHTVPSSGQAYGLTEAPRGALGHWLQIAATKLARYQVVTPTCWNASPRCALGRPGPIEQALLGTTVRDWDQPIELLRVVHAFDPCLACAVHVMRPGGPVVTVARSRWAPQPV